MHDGPFNDPLQLPFTFSTAHAPRLQPYIRVPCTRMRPKMRHTSLVEEGVTDMRYVVSIHQME